MSIQSDLTTILQRVSQGLPSGFACSQQLAEFDLTPFDPDQTHWEDELRLGALLLRAGQLSQAAHWLPPTHPLYSVISAFRGDPIPQGREHWMATAISKMEPPRDVEEAGGKSFAKTLVIVVCLQVLWNWVDQAPAVLEFQVQQVLRRGRAWMSRVSWEYPILHPRLWLLEAQYAAFSADSSECCQKLRLLLSSPLSHQQLPVLEQALELLRHLEKPQFDRSRLSTRPDPERLPQWERFHKALDLLPAFLQQSPEDPSVALPEQVVELLYQVFRSHQVFWLQLEAEAQWQCIAYRGPAGFRFWSQSLLDKVVDTWKATVYVRQHDETQRSIILSEARSVMVSPVGQRVLLYLSHQKLDGCYQSKDLELLEWLSHFVEVRLQQDKQLSQEQLADDKLQRYRQQALEECQQAGVAAAWLDPQAAWQSWNAGLEALMGTPNLVQGQSVAHHPVLSRDLESWFKLWSGGTSTAGLLRGYTGQGVVQILRCQLDQDPSTQWRLLLLEDATSSSSGDVLALLERERHLLASRLHDGPAQSATALRMSCQDPQESLAVTRCLMEIRDLLQWLRSPVEEGIAFQTALTQLVKDSFPEIAPVVDVSGQVDWQTSSIALFRSIQDCLELLSDFSVSDQFQVEVRLCPPLLQANLKACPAVEEPQLLEHARTRLALVAGRLEQGEQGWTLSVPYSSGISSMPAGS